jgi:hypothetical protein
VLRQIYRFSLVHNLQSLSYCLVEAMFLFCLRQLFTNDEYIWGSEFFICHEAFYFL